MTYIARAKPQKLMDELMKEMLSIDAVNTSVERTEEPPYFQLFDKTNSSEVSGAENMGSIASLIAHTSRKEVSSDKASSEKGDKSEKSILEKGMFDKAMSEKGDSHEKGTQVHEKSLSAGKLSPSQSSGSDEVWKERDKSSRYVCWNNSTWIYKYVSLMYLM